MSVRRSTRASSRAASSTRDQSPVAFTVMETPRRNPRRKANKAPLPAVPVQASTAYGTKSPVKPASLSQDGHDEDLDTVLQDVTRQQQATMEAYGNLHRRNARQGSVESNISRATEMSFPARLRSRPAPVGIPRAGDAEKPRTIMRRGPTAGEASFQNESFIYVGSTCLRRCGHWIGAFARKAPYPFIFILLLVAAAATVSALLGSSAVKGTNIWSTFIRHNDTFDDLWARRLKDALRDNVLVSKSEFIEAVQKNRDDSKSLKAEVAVNVEESIQAAKQQITELTKSEAKSILEDLFRTDPRLQLEALAKANIHRNAEYSLLRFNHFSPGVGAVVNPSLISPTYRPPKSPKFLSRLLFGYRPPHPAVEALTRWDEVGDCWCAPSQGTRSGVQLGVLIGNDIYPDEIVVEHVPKTATLIPGNTPRRMELFALIREDALDAVGELSSSLFPDAPVEVALDGNWVRLASWEYDIDGAIVQFFPVAVNLKALRVGVRHFVVRARTNWGGDREVASSDHTCLYRVRLHGDVSY